MKMRQCAEIPGVDGISHAKCDPLERSKDHHHCLIQSFGINDTEQHPKMLLQALHCFYSHAVPSTLPATARAMVESHEVSIANLLGAGAKVCGRTYPLLA